ENWQNVAKLLDPVGGGTAKSTGTYALEYLAAHVFGPLGIGTKFGTELLLNRILFDKAWTGWLGRATDAMKSTGTVPDSFVNEGTEHLKAEGPAPKLSQGPAPTGQRADVLTPPTGTEGHTYEYEKNADAHQVTVRNPEGNSVAIVHAIEEE